MAIGWDSPVQYLKGVGEHRAALFDRLGVRTVGDLLRHYPRGYEDWSAPLSIDEAPFGEPCCVCASLVGEVKEHRVRPGMVLYRCLMTDGRSRLQVTLFNNRFLAQKLRRGRDYLLYGQVAGTYHLREMASPQIEEAALGKRIRPLYPQTEGLPSRTIEKAVSAAMEGLGAALDQEILPPTLLREYELCPRGEALRAIHFPAGQEQLDRARRRLVFEELLLLQLGLLRLKGRARGETAAVIETDYTDEFARLLPFSLTGAQRRAIGDCVADLRRGRPMSRLIQGDVGSGKTAVAAGVAYTLVRSGWQVAMMAPTEILAEQHRASLSRLLAPAKIPVGLLTGSLPAAEKREVRAGLRDGSLPLVVGTHALLSEGVQFDRLGLVITDEQHRFGVGQRAALAAKGENPHLLVMSATPIPRTLALIVYGDLDISVLNELPPGRQPVATYAVGSDKRERAYAYIRKHIDEGRQAYIVCPLVEEQEESDSALQAATTYLRQLQNGPFAGYSLGLLHGRMKSAEKEAVMAAFARGEISVLVATTVIEVGVDVPNAVLILIENAERFGLAQLHQLRGRVGRGRYASTCILISDARNEEARRRLRVMCETNDGFRIADEDLRLRGPGDFFGNRQHGLPHLKLASLSDDMGLFRQAQAAAAALVGADPLLSLPEHGALAQAVNELFAGVGEQGLN